MKLKVKALAAAATMAVAGHASAALQDFFVQNGTLLVTVWNVNAPQQSYVRDLGVTLDDFLASPSSTGFSLGDAAFTSLFAGVASSDLRWNVIAADQVTGDGVDNGARVLTTFSQGIGLMTFANVDGMAQQTVLWSGTNNLNGCDVSVSCTSTGLGPTYGGDASWSTDYSGQAAPGNNSGTGYSSVNFYFLQGGEVATTQDVNEKLLGTLSLAANGNVTFASAAVAPVPLPAAAWMFGAGLMSLAGVIRRRRVTAE